MKKISLAIAATSLLAASALHAQITFDWATVGYVGNPADTMVMIDGTSGYGSIAYEYRIARHEVTNEQYAAFLNAVAATDPYGLYDARMGSGAQFRGGITRLGADGSYTYEVRTNLGNKPVNYISWYDAARFCNWMTNGQPSGGGGTESGVYTLDGPTSISAITRDVSNPSQVFLPSENEWYKAAYHKPFEQGGDPDGYALYATGFNFVPVNATATSTGDVANPGVNIVNYNLGADWNGQNGHFTTVGSAGNSSFHGAFDLNGNALEWNESLVGDARGVRGGSIFNSELILRSSGRYSLPPTYQDMDSGFRVASHAAPAPCPADWDNSGGEPNSSDFLAYLNDFSAQDPAADLAPPGNPPGDGVFDSSDFLAFLNLYAQGC